jgi:hypothetical protein
MDNVKEKFACETETVSEDTSLRDFEDAVNEINAGAEVPEKF